MFQVLSSQIRPYCSQKKCTQGSSNPTERGRFVNSINSNGEEFLNLLNHNQSTERTEALFVAPSPLTLSFSERQ